MKRVAVVILNWNGRKMLEKYLSSVVEYSRQDADIIVADNASTDDSLDWLAQHGAHVRVIRLAENYGFAGGYNKALEQLPDYEYYVLLNSDVEVTHHWLVPLVEAMDAHQEIAACQPKLLSYLHRDSFEYAGACGGYLDKYGYPFCRGRIFDVVEDDNGQYDDPQEVLWATGACLLVRSEDYWRVGGLDERFFAHNEEIDFCWRLHNSGRQIFCIPESTVYHLGGGTLPKSNPRKTFLNFRNNLTMLWKNLPEKDLRHVMRVRWFLDYLAAFQFLILKRSWGDFKAVIKGRRTFRKWRKEFVRTPSVAKAFVPEDDMEDITLPEEHHAMTRDGRSNFSLLYEFYVRGIKEYSKLP